MAPLFEASGATERCNLIGSMQKAFASITYDVHSYGFRMGSVREKLFFFEARMESGKIVGKWGTQGKSALFVKATSPHSADHLPRTDAQIWRLLSTPHRLMISVTMIDAVLRNNDKNDHLARILYHIVGKTDRDFLMSMLKRYEISFVCFWGWLGRHTFLLALSLV